MWVLKFLWTVLSWDIVSQMSLLKNNRRRFLSLSVYVSGNLVPRVLFFPSPGARKKRWSLVSQQKKNSPDGIPVLEGSSPQILVNIIWFLRSAMFYSSLHFAIVNSSYWNINLKPKQVQSLEAIYFRRDTIGVLPTGDRKERTLGTRLCLR